jgi:hypothetical protein
VIRFSPFLHMYKGQAELADETVRKFIRTSGRVPEHTTNKHGDKKSDRRPGHGKDDQDIRDIHPNNSPCVGRGKNAGIGPVLQCLHG